MLKHWTRLVRIGLAVAAEPRVVVDPRNDPRGDNATIEYCGGAVVNVALPECVGLLRLKWFEGHLGRLPVLFQYSSIDVAQPQVAVKG